MDRKFSIPVGVAMLAALALVGMLGIFAFNAAQPAQAGGIATVTVTADPSTPGDPADYTITITTNAALSSTDTLNITPPTENAPSTEGPIIGVTVGGSCLLYTSPSPRDRQKSRMPSSA